jgi:hypothetical protein
MALTREMVWRRAPGEDEEVCLLRCLIQKNQTFSKYVPCLLLVPVHSSMNSLRHIDSVLQQRQGTTRRYICIVRVPGTAAG